MTESKSDELQVWSCDPSTIPDWTEEDIKRLDEVLRRYIIQLNQDAKEFDDEGRREHPHS